MTVLEAEPRLADDDHDDGLTHVVCQRCDPDRTLCGITVEGPVLAQDVPSGPVCVVCDDLADIPCPCCGAF